MNRIIIALFSVFYLFSSPGLVAQDCLVDVGPDLSLILGGNVTLIAQTNVANVQSISWEPTDYLSCTDCFDPVATPLEDICYVITLTDTENCEARDTVCIVFDACHEEVIEDNQIKSISPEILDEEAEIELEIARSQFAEIKLTQGGDELAILWEGFLYKGITIVDVDFASFNPGTYTLEVDLYPEPLTLDISIN